MSGCRSDSLNTMTSWPGAGIFATCGGSMPPWQIRWLATLKSRSPHPGPLPRGEGEVVSAIGWLLCCGCNRHCLSDRGRARSPHRSLTIARERRTIHPLPELIFTHIFSAGHRGYQSCHRCGPPGRQNSPRLSEAMISVVNPDFGPGPCRAGKMRGSNCFCSLSGCHRIVSSSPALQIRGREFRSQKLNRK
jgi:hypothetical protein